MAKIIEQKSRPTVKQRMTKLNESMQSSQAWNSIFRPGSIFRKGYSDSPRNRSYVVMNSVLYHLHPVKVKRHAVKVSYTLCLGGLSFFLFILLTITGIFLMFFYRPTAANAWQDIQSLHTSVTFGLMVRNMHRWAAHLMVLSVFLHMARVFYHGAYKAPREFNWVIGVILLTLTLLLSFTGYLLPWDQLALWAVTVGTNMMGYSPVIGSQVRFVLLGGVEIGQEWARCLPRPAQHAAIRAPWSEDTELRHAIDALRQQGETVVCVLPGHDSEADEFNCNRELVRQGTQWHVQPIHP